MTKAKATKLDTEIKEALFDPKKSISQITAKEWSAKKKHGYTLIKNGQKYILRLDKGKTVLEPVKVFDPKKPATAKQSHVYKVGWKAKTGFKVKSFWTKAEMDKLVAKLKKAGIWYKAWQAGTDKVYDPNRFMPSANEGKAWREGLKSKKNAMNPYSKDTSEWEYWNMGRQTAGQKITIRDLAYDPKTSSSPPTRWYEAMVRGIKKSSDVRNPYAIVKSIWAKLSPAKKAEIKAREKKGERFKYDLPLPVDKPTKGTGTVRMVKPFKLAEVQVNLSVKDYLAARASGLFSRMKRDDGTTALVSRCKSPKSNTNIFIDKMK